MKAANNELSEQIERLLNTNNFHLIGNGHGIVNLHALAELGRGTVHAIKKIPGVTRFEFRGRAQKKKKLFHYVLRVTPDKVARAARA